MFEKECAKLKKRLYICDNSLCPVIEFAVLVDVFLQGVRVLCPCCRQIGVFRGQELC